MEEFDLDWDTYSADPSYDMPKMCMEYVKQFVQGFNDYINGELELDIKLSFESMTSPREYNFETDKIFCEISYPDVKKLYRFLDKEKLRATIKDYCTSYDGFISFYSNDLDLWCEKPLLHWDHNEVGMLFTCLREHYFEIGEYEIMPELWHESIEFPYNSSWKNSEERAKA